MLSVQQLIAWFLDRETAKIDALVAKKERLIELLQENAPPSSPAPSPRTSTPTSP